MAESLFDIFGDHLTRQTIRNVNKQPLFNNENLGKTVSAGPIKPNEPVKKAGESKKSFLCNAGKALQSSTPSRKAFTPRAQNVNPIFDDNFKFEEIQFTKPKTKHENIDMFDFLLPRPQIPQEEVPPKTPPPAIRPHNLELDNSYEDDFFTDDFSSGSLPCDEDLGLPDLY